MADNVIKAVFASGRRVKTAPLWRYDHGIRLQPIGLELPENYEMHFSNSKTGEATTMLADSTGAVIPAEYLIPGTEVYAWIYLVGDSYGRTKAEIIIPVDPKAQPTDQEPTPEQQPVIEQAIDALNDAQDALEEAASHIIERGITPEERAKLAGIEAGAEVNVIEEVRVFDLLRGYVPLPVTDKGVDLPPYPEVENANDVVYVDFDVDDTNLTVSCDLTPEESIAGEENNGQTIIGRAHLIGSGKTAFLPLSDYVFGEGFYVKFSGFIDARTKLEVVGGELNNWTAIKTTLLDQNTANSYFIQKNQGSANAGKVLTVGSDGNVAPQDAAGGDNVFVAAYGVTTQEELEAAYQAGKALFCDYVQPNAPEIVRRLSLFARYSNGADYYFYFTGVEVDPGDIITEFIASCGVGALDAWQIQKINSPLPNPNPRQNPAALGTASPGTSTYYSRHDHVHQMPSAADVGAVTANQGTAHAGEFLVVGSDGTVTPQEVAAKAASLPMGHLDSTSTATVMTAQVDGITELRDGVCVWLRNNVVTSASGVTLNVNSLGAKPIYSSLYGGVVANTFTAASTYLFVYNATRVTGGCWDMVYGYDTNTTYSPAKMGFGYATCYTSEDNAAKTAALPSYTLTTGGYVTVKFTNAVSAGATLNINSKGAKAIYYREAAIPAGVIKAGDTVTFVYSSYYHVVAIIPAEDESALPAVSSSDNGKVLRVVNGTWTAVSLPSASGVSF